MDQQDQRSTTERQRSTAEGSAYMTSAGIHFGAPDDAVDAPSRDARPAAACAADDA